MSKTTFTFKTSIARRIPDPVFKKQFGTERHLFVVKVKDMPLEISTDPNARKSNINKQVYRDVEKSLLNQQEHSEPNSFHLKNKGITIIADSVEQFGDHEYKVILDNSQNHGIVDGGHTYALIAKHKKECDLPDEQYVNVEVRTGIQLDWIKDISGGLNTGVQVQAMSLDNLQGMFERIKTELKKYEMDTSIAWSENDEGQYNARDIISLMLCFNIDIDGSKYKNSEQPDHPIEAYSSKASVLKKFEDKTDSFNRMIPILKDILRLHDVINTTAGELWNNGGGKLGNGGKAGLLVWMNYKNPQNSKKSFHYPFTNSTSEYQLSNGALYPILAAFRWYVKYDEYTQTIVWRVPFSQINQAWMDVAMQLLRATADMCDELGRNPNALGKSKPHWGNMYNIVKAHDLSKNRQ